MDHLTRQAEGWFLGGNSLPIVHMQLLGQKKESTFLVSRSLLPPYLVFPVLCGTTLILSKPLLHQKIVLSDHLFPFYLCFLRTISHLPLQQSLFPIALTGPLQTDEFCVFLKKLTCFIKLLQIQILINHQYFATFKVRTDWAEIGKDTLRGLNTIKSSSLLLVLRI